MIGLEWTLPAQRSLADVLAFIRAQERGHPDNRRREIMAAAELLCAHPLIGIVVGKRGRNMLRSWVVASNFILYYMYLDSHGPNARISIRYVRHVLEGARTEGVREVPQFAASLGVS